MCSCFNSWARTVRFLDRFKFQHRLIWIDVYFHTVLFPAMLLADGGKWTTLHNISSTRQSGRIWPLDWTDAFQST